MIQSSLVSMQPSDAGSVRSRLLWDVSWRLAGCRVKSLHLGGIQVDAVFSNVAVGYVLSIVSSSGSLDTAAEIGRLDHILRIKKVDEGLASVRFHRRRSLVGEFRPSRGEGLLG